MGEMSNQYVPIAMFLNVFQVYFKFKQLFRNISQRSALGRIGMSGRECGMV